MNLQSPELQSILRAIPLEEHEQAMALLTAVGGATGNFRQLICQPWRRPVCQLGLLGDCEVAVPSALPSARPLNVKQFLAYRIRLPLTAFCLTVGIVLTILSPPKIIPGSSLNHLLIAAGYLMLMLGILLRIWSILHIQMRKSVRLVMSGPYSLSRNPLYLGTFLIISGYLLMVQSLTLACCCLPVIALYAWGVVPAEEQVLFHRHGEAFLGFCRQVPRWLPTPGRFHWSLFRETILCWSSSVRREMECGGWWLLIGLLIHLACSQRLAAWWSHPLLWP